MYISPKEYKQIIDKFKKLEGLEEDLQSELKKLAVDSVSKARADFNGSAKPYLEQRGENTSGLSSTIKYRLLKRKKGSNAYRLSAGDNKHPIMAYIEFGTRRRRINLSGIRKIFGAKGKDYAMQFKGSDDKRKWTNTSARPYFYKNVYNENKQFLRRMKSRIKKLIKSK